MFRRKLLHKVETISNTFDIFVAVDLDVKRLPNFSSIIARSPMTERMPRGALSLKVLTIMFLFCRVAFYGVLRCFPGLGLEL